MPAEWGYGVQVRLRQDVARALLELSFKDYPQLRPAALRAALVSSPRPAEVADALDRLQNVDPGAARRVREDPRGVSEGDLYWLASQTDTARGLLKRRIESR
jgi:hypothetical protein